MVFGTPSENDEQSVTAVFWSKVPSVVQIKSHAALPEQELHFGP